MANPKPEDFLDSRDIAILELAKGQAHLLTALVTLLVCKGLITSDEFSQAVESVTSAVDQKWAEMSDNKIAEILEECKSGAS